MSTETITPSNIYSTSNQRRILQLQPVLSHQEKIKPFRSVQYKAQQFFVRYPKGLWSLKIDNLNKKYWLKLFDKSYRKGRHLQYLDYLELDIDAIAQHSDFKYLFQLIKNQNKLTYIQPPKKFNVGEPINTTIIENIKASNKNKNFKTLEFTIDDANSIDHNRALLTSLKRITRSMYDINTLNITLSAKYASSEEINLRLSEIISSQFCLQKLTLKVGSAFMMSEQDFAILVNDLWKCKQLKYVEVELVDGLMMTDETIIILIEQVQLIKGLKKFSLSTKMCPELSDRCLEELNSSFDRIIKLQEVEMKFDGCLNMTAKGIDHFKKEVQKKKNLKKWTLDFEGCSTEVECESPY